MVQLTRTVRFSVNDDGWGMPAADAATNTFAAFPTMRGLGRHYELDIHCRGEPDPVTGYFLNIKEIDQAARGVIIPVIARACAERPRTNPGEVLREVMIAMDNALGGGKLGGVRWKLSPYYSVEVQMSSLHTCIIRQQFEFAAAHRLHIASLTDEENRACFGKCNNPSGHGHNYRVEPAVEVPVGTGAGGTGAGGEGTERGERGTFTLADLERVTHDTIIKRFDHTHLNLDTREFAPETGLNPSVENIAKVCYDLLAPAIRQAAPGARLRGVTVWETDKTSCTYPA